eukprot:1839693-Alexandrium_andersonii.AAC.1
MRWHGARCAAPLRAACAVLHGAVLCAVGLHGACKVRRGVFARVCACACHGSCILSPRPPLKDSLSLALWFAPWRICLPTRSPKQHRESLGPLAETVSYTHLRAHETSAHL